MFIQQQRRLMCHSVFHRQNRKNGNVWQLTHLTMSIPFLYVGGEKVTGSILHKKKTNLRSFIEQ